MGAKIPKEIQETSLSRQLQEKGLELLFQGKVRDTYNIPGHPDKLLVVSTNRISIFDLVLPATVTNKGYILNALNVFWLTGQLKNIPNHLIAYGSKIDKFLRGSDLSNNVELRQRAIVVKKCTVIPVEWIIRGYLEGSAWRAYQAGGPISGITLPPGLIHGSRLPQPIFTPTTKATAGHDLPITAEEVVKKYGQAPIDMAMNIYSVGSTLAREHYIHLADTKFEFGYPAEIENPKIGDPILLIDEVLTPDSSRFWDDLEWVNAQERKVAPQGYDKEPVREWGRGVETRFGFTGLHKLDPENPDHIEFVHNLVVPPQVTDATQKRYQSIFHRLTKETLMHFQDNVMRVNTKN